jgi:hypothetical protein
LKNAKHFQINLPEFYPETGHQPDQPDGTGGKFGIGYYPVCLLL